MARPSQPRASTGGSAPRADTVRFRVPGECLMDGRRLFSALSFAATVSILAPPLAAASPADNLPAQRRGGSEQAAGPVNAGRAGNNSGSAGNSGHAGNNSGSGNAGTSGQVGNNGGSGSARNNGQ